MGRFCRVTYMINMLCIEERENYWNISARLNIFANIMLHLASVLQSVQKTQQSLIDEQYNMIIAYQ